MYKALTTFTDLQDNNYRYQAGDTFPRKGIKVSDERIAELLSDKNRRHKPVIEEIVKEEPKKEEVKPAPKKSATTKKPTTGGRKKADAK